MMKASYQTRARKKTSSISNEEYSEEKAFLDLLPKGKFDYKVLKIFQ